jgi:hypothetical protein
MRPDQLVQRRQDSRRSADQVGQGRQIEVDTFAGVALALPVERLVAALLLEQALSTCWSPSPV